MDHFNFKKLIHNYYVICKTEIFISFDHILDYVLIIVYY